MMPPSESGVSITRSAPNSSWRSLGDAKDAADLADVLAQQDHARVARISSRRASLMACTMFI
jgi:hypothetical protein